MDHLRFLTRDLPASIPWRCLVGAVATATVIVVAVRPQTATGGGDKSEFQSNVRPILEANCNRCHGTDKPKGNVNLAALTDDAAARKARRTWRKAIGQIESGEMPPADAKQLTPAERQRLLTWMKAAVKSDGADRDPGPALVRRLSRPEYNRTIRDLFGVDFDAGDAAGIPDESQGFGFANQDGVLSLSPTLMEKYFAAADHVLDRVLGPAGEMKLATAPAKGPEKPPPAKEPETPAAKGPIALEYKCAGPGAGENQIRPHFQIVNSSSASVPLRELTIRYWFNSGGESDFQTWCDYAKVDAKNVVHSVKKAAKAVKVADAFIEVGFGGGTLNAGGSTGEIHIRVAKKDWHAFDLASDYSFDPGKSSFAESPRVTLYREGKLIWGREPDATSKALQGPTPAAPGKGEKAPPKDDPKMLAIREALFVARPGAGVTEQEAARKIAEAFARKAWRRPVQAVDLAPLLAVFDRAASKGADFPNAVRPMLKAALVSPHFLFRVERDRVAGAGHEFRRVTDHELAVRLSYFLWSSMPDPELDALAEQGKLSDPTVLEKQTRRMLAEPKARALTDHFGVPWLQLGNLATARPTVEFFPSFVPSLKEAMYAEATLFFDKLREGDRSLLELIDSDYAYVNEELARHYGIDGVSGRELRKVNLKPQHHRGGLLGMGAVLASTSHTFRTSPTMRGKYVLEVILGTPPPPPPANAGVLKDEPKGKPPKTFRESLARHSTDPTCAACHVKIDPLGFGLENFDGVGRWRQGDASQLDVTGQLPSGEKFAGPEQLKAILLKRQDQFLFNVSEQMLTYALGRPLQDCDESAMLDVQSAVQAGDNRFSALVVGVVKSFPFQHRRNVKE